MPFTRLNQQTYHEREPERNKAPSARDRAWTQVFRTVVEGKEPLPEEKCHRCVRYYGLYTSERSTAQDSVNDGDADAGYAAGDVGSAIETVELMVKDGCIEEGVARDTAEITKKLDRAEEQEDKDLVEEALDALDELPILEQVVAGCCKGIPR